MLHLNSDIQMKLIVLSIIQTLVLANPMKPVTFADDIIYTDNNTYYTAEYDIVDINLPIHFMENNKVFIIQADTKNNNTHKGAFMLHITFGDYHNVTARKILENGKCITSDEEGVYFGTTDGIYTYNFSNDAVEKYGSISADIRDIEKVKRKDLIYVVTEDNELYIVTETGNKMVEHDSIRNVQEIATDGNGNLYFYEKHEDPEKHLQFFEKYSKPEVLVGNNIVKISGLPDKYTNIKLVNFLQGGSALLILNNMVYQILSNGTSTDQRFAFLDVPTAFSVEAGLMQLYGNHRKLYCYVVNLAPVIEGILKGLGELIKRVISEFSD